MDADEARQRLEAERARLTEVRSDFDSENLTEESEDENLS